MTVHTWRPLAACLLCGALAGWTAQGWSKDASIAELQRAAAIQTATAATELAQATARVLTLERAAGAALALRADHLTQEQSHAKTERDRFNDDVRSGAVRLSIPVAGGHCAGPADSTAAAGHRHQARAELDAATAAALDAIAGDGDDATRQLNACIDAYNLIRDTYHVQTE
ncbi:lysis system i-spanin subunit Rz [Janthinobacterium lividum]|uniref:Lysis system i-spanin subunit Rz n=1 Tax=Janthinobacterium lividum TaxID=29581 RepID=A0ABU0Y262_9BURK|nr:lysis system i-spanin subunit Rz [Janthinobacterium lividum]MDQ4628676.1 lysis system i-spanin subunit Rz [Janthinobacterium lividum]MDQ4677098.1 lysis system i-spanin subunit Rz [Janthinobacterium lividum]MDQ4687635.1 lysis system i-spanin subunit Rz [Janthinobacterium lividum]